MIQWVYIYTEKPVKPGLETVLQPVLDDKSAVRNRARMNRKSMYPATYPTSIHCLTFLLISLSVSLSLTFFFLYLCVSEATEATASLFYGQLCSSALN